MRTHKAAIAEYWHFPSVSVLHHGKYFDQIIMQILVYALVLHCINTVQCGGHRYTFFSWQKYVSTGKRPLLLNLELPTMMGLLAVTGTYRSRGYVSQI